MYLLLCGNSQVPRGNERACIGIHKIPSGYGGVSAVASIIEPAGFASTVVYMATTCLTFCCKFHFYGGTHLILEVTVDNPGIALEWKDAAVSVSDDDGLITRQVANVGHSKTRPYLSNTVMTLQDRSTSTITSASISFTLPQPYPLLNGECVDFQFPEGFSLSAAPISIHVSSPDLGTMDISQIEGRSIMWCFPPEVEQSHSPGTIIDFKVREFVQLQSMVYLMELLFIPGII